MSAINVNDIKPHAAVIAACGTKVGDVDHLEGSNQIKLTKHGDGHHHLIPTAWVSQINGDQIILNKDSEEVKSEWTAI